LADQAGRWQGEGTLAARDLVHDLLDIEATGDYARVRILNLSGEEAGYQPAAGCQPAPLGMIETIARL
jgi:hypothetical protein